jgi:septum formation protein
MNCQIILASQSPRRKELLSKWIDDLTIVKSAYHEKINPEGDPKHEVMRAALMKGLAVDWKVDRPGVILSADTIVHHQRILGKPRDEEDAFRMLSLLSGQWHSVYTGFALIEPLTGKKVVDYVRTKVKFNLLDISLIEWYIQSGEPLDKAGAYGIQNLGALLVEEIRGDYFNVVGLPVAKIHSVLKKHFDCRLY